MVTVICNADGCANNAVTYNVLGVPPFVECGGCGAHLEPTDERPDPEMPSMFPEVI
jgi:hypothetical protein